MKLYTPENTDLMEITKIETAPEGLIISGTIMGAMPMKAMLRPKELRAGFKFLSFKLIFHVFAMLFKRGK